ncbi:hypothetical protein GCM10007874_21700 [Labrys miyagiensis]|uniref:Uncharacterized protein n=1 Tax=Labrys miyagiensis TaxID=346912 RepID=A0ABQ6CFV1_9HYPH|nr:hypothetical protein GCM10007874_21700 [Labrys miyagiensis]
MIRAVGITLAFAGDNGLIDMELQGVTDGGTTETNFLSVRSLDEQVSLGISSGST